MKYAGACLRTRRWLNEVPLIMNTALGDREPRLKGIQAGADGFISIPFYVEELSAQVSTVICCNRYRRLIDEKLTRTRSK
jgi:DNA-binding response OmpR family regulator